MLQPLLLFLLLLFFTSTSLAAKTCYYPNGEANKDEPCDPDAEVSACCGTAKGSICMSNKLCQGPNGRMIRGSCTDKDWGSDDCPLFCLAADRGGTDLIPCSNVTQIDTSYCCDPPSPYCCETGVGMFDVLPSKPRIWAVWDDENDHFSVMGTVIGDNKPTTTGLSSMPQSTASTSASASTTMTISTSSAPSSSTSSSESSAPTDTQSEDSSGTSITVPALSTGAKIGIGVGASVGAILIAAVIYLLWKIHHNANGTKEKANPPSYCAEPPQGPWYAPKSPQELHGHQGQGHGIRAELS